MGKQRPRGVLQLVCTALGVDLMGTADPTSSSCIWDGFIFRTPWMMERGRSWGGSLGMGRGLSPGHPTPLFHHGSSTGKEWSDKKNQNRTDKPKLKKKKIIILFQRPQSLFLGNQSLWFKLTYRAVEIEYLKSRVPVAAL